MNIVLNDEALGGGMIYLTPQGGMETEYDQVGSGVIQKDGIAHAMSPFVGTRYFLVLFHSGIDTDAMTEIEL